MNENKDMINLLTNLTNVINDLHTCLGGIRDIIAREVDSGACSAPTKKYASYKDEDQWKRDLNAAAQKAVVVTGKKLARKGPK